MAIDELLAASESELLQRGYRVEQLLDDLRDSVLPSLTGWFSIQKIRQSAESVLDYGWKFARFDPVPVRSLDDWAQYGRHHRSWGFHLHAWEFMDPVLAAADDDPDGRWLDELVQIAISWLLIQREVDEDYDPLVWYDMSLSLRLPRLIAVTLRAARRTDLRDETVKLSAAILKHLQELELDRAFNPKNNHGFYAAVSQAHAGKYLSAFGHDDEVARRDGNARLAIMAKSQFADDGVHLEHSPDYHRMLLASFQHAIADNLIEDENIRVRIERAAHALGWMIQPDGTLVQFGDSPATRMVGVGARSIDPSTAYILSDGSEGEAPEEELAVYQKGGYAFVRSPRPSKSSNLRDSGYVAYSAAFHSRAHKHADDLNLVWYDRGHQILTDSGRYGYGDLLAQDSPLRSKGFYYSSPERQYVESSPAHNVLVVDEEDHQRKGRKPYGSALTECTQVGTRFDLSGRVRHADYVHRRRVLYSPGRELKIVDSLHSKLSRERTATIWLNINGQFDLNRVDGQIVFHIGHGSSMHTLVVTGPGELVSPVRGQESPLRGWRSRADASLEPAWSLGYSFKFVTRSTVTTTLKFE